MTVNEATYNIMLLKWFTEPGHGKGEVGVSNWCRASTLQDGKVVVAHSNVSIPNVTELCTEFYKPSHLLREKTLLLQWKGKVGKTH